MGPNARRRNRERYVNYRLKILDECHVQRPKPEIIAKMKDEKQMSEIQVDAIFLTCIKHSRG